MKGTKPFRTIIPVRQREINVFNLALVLFLGGPQCFPAPVPADYSLPAAYLDGQANQPCLVAVKSRINPGAVVVGCFPAYVSSCDQLNMYRTAQELSSSVQEATSYSRLFSQCSLPVSRVTSRLNALQTPASLPAYDIGGTDGPHVTGINLVLKKVITCDIIGNATQSLVTPREGVALATIEGLLSAEDDAGTCRPRLNTDTLTREAGEAVNKDEKHRFNRCTVGASVAGIQSCPETLNADSEIQALLN